MSRLSNCIIVIISFVVIVSCSRDRLRPLPYYIGPDLTPVWIRETSDSFKSIHTIPAFSFRNQDGEVVTEKNVAGKIYVTNFIFTSCGSICPKMTANFSILQKAFANDNDVLLLSHTVNPEVDSVATLKRYAGLKKIDAKKWALLTGSKTDLYTIAKKEYFAGDSIGYYGDLNEFLHTEKVFLVDKQRRIRGVYNGTLPIEMDRIKEDIATLKKEE
jgi:protein SCO1/2